MAERNTDTVPAMLTPGEFVITDKAVENAGGPGFFYWLMNALDPSSKKAREDGYQFGGSVLGSLLSRTQKKDEGPVYPKPDFTIPAGKNILGQSTEEMGPEELMEMITPMGSTKWAAKLLSRKGAKKVLPVVQKEGEKFLGKYGKRLYEYIEPHKQGWQVGGHGKVTFPKRVFKDTSSLNKEIKWLKEAVSDTEKSINIMKEAGRKPGWRTMDLLTYKRKLNALESLAKTKSSEMSDVLKNRDYVNFLKEYIKKGETFPEGFKRGGSIDDYSLMDYMMPAMDKRLGPSLKKFQYGGGVPPNPNDPKYTHYMTQMAASQSGAQTGAMPQPSAQSQLIQPSNIYSTGIGSIFGEMGLQTPGSEYLENIQAYDPTQQRRMQQDLSMKMPGPTESAGGFAGSGAAIKKAGEEREAVTQKYTRGAEDLRKQYREQIMQDVLADMSAGTYEFEDLG